METEKIRLQMRRGVLEYAVLSVIGQGDAYSSDILESLKEAHLLVVEGTLYPLLSRLKNEGLLNYRWEESPSGPPRKYYGLTELGERFLAEMDTTWDELVEAVNRTTSKRRNK
jgi:PadR family transcriptional regulator PadR